MVSRKHHRDGPPLSVKGKAKYSGGKRRGSQASLHCSRCLRRGHHAHECRHLLTCRRCKGAGHVAVNCLVENLTDRRRLEPNPLIASKEDQGGKLSAKPFLSLQRSTLCIPLSPDIIKTKNEFKKVFIITVTSGYCNADALNLLDGGSVKWFRLNSYILLLNNSEEAKILENWGSCEIKASHGPCSLTISPRSPKFGLVSPAAGPGVWALVRLELADGC